METRPTETKAYDCEFKKIVGLESVAVADRRRARRMGELRGGAAAIAGRKVSKP